MKKVIRLTESDLSKIVRRVIREGKINEQLIFAAGAGIAAVAYYLMNKDKGSTNVRNAIYECNRQSVQPTQRSNSLADQIYKSVKGLGTNESSLFNAFRSIQSTSEFCSVVKSYKNTYSEDLWSALDGDIDSESEWVQIFRPLRDIATREQQSKGQK